VDAAVGGGCDAHVHLFGPLQHYPPVAGAAYAVPDATPEQLLANLDAAGLRHAVVVHAAAVGRDNRRTLDALREHPGRLRGVILPPTKPVDDKTLAQWHALGVRGVRFSYTGKAPADLRIDPDLVSRIADFGWHAQVHVEDDQILALGGVLRNLSAPVVIDHMARIPAAWGARSESFRGLQALLDTGRVWIKLSAPMRLSSQPAPYPDVEPMVRALVAQAPQRLVWGSDWPHVNHAGAIPTYAELLALLARWVPDDATRRRIQVDNPAVLYGLGQPTSATEP
jgi:predicted TIM-barrel fold metal-dependent hydrolase